MSIDAFNALADTAAAEALGRCCVSRRWIEGVLAGRPYADDVALREAARRSWLQLGEEDCLEAFEGHPKIGDIHSLRAKYAASGDLAAQEQAGVAQADDALIERLAAGNAEYERRFGFIFIVCATGRSAAEMCTLLERRLHNDRDKELRIAADEQLKILMIRLEQLL